MKGGRSKGEIVGDGGVVVAKGYKISRVDELEKQWQYIMIGIGLLSAIFVYQAIKPFWDTALAKYPGASTMPHCAPESLASNSSWSVSSMPCVAVPARMG